MRLLVVEDEVGMATALRRGLEAERFVVDVVSTGPAGLASASAGGYDAVLLDIMLPGLSGYEVVRRLRADSVWVPVILMSAKDGEHDQADGLDCGADDYLIKPFSFVVLLARLRALLRRRPAPRPAVLNAGGVQLDPASKQVTHDGRQIKLSPREFTLLEYLMRQAGRVASKTELLDHVWDAAEDTDPNVVEVYIGYLRRKLGAGLVRTVRGAGYRIEP